MMSTGLAGITRSTTPIKAAEARTTRELIPPLPPTCLHSHPSLPLALRATLLSPQTYYHPVLPPAIGRERPTLRHPYSHKRPCALPSKSHYTPWLTFPSGPSVMPAASSTPTKSTTAAPYPSPNKNWSSEDKAMVFEHVRLHGEGTWGDAVPGKTAQQVSLKDESSEMELMSGWVESGAVEVGRFGG